MREDGLRQSLILADGDLPGLVAAALVRAGGGAPAWLIAANGTRRRAAAETQAATLKVPLIAGSLSGHRSKGEMLAMAWKAARQSSCHAVVVPVCARDDLAEHLAWERAKAEAVALARSAGAHVEPRFEFPFLARTMREVADLAVDLGVDPGLCWWDARFDQLCDDVDPLAARWEWEGVLGGFRIEASPCPRGS